MLNTFTPLWKNWPENHFQLISLMALLRAKAENFCRSMETFGQCVAILKAAAAGIAIPDSSVAYELGRALLVLKQNAQDLGLRSTLQQIERIEKITQNPPLGGPDELRRLLLELEHRFTDELESIFFLSVSFSHTPYYEQKTPLFGEEVNAKFPRLTEDISEAGKCFALGRYTAAVFHLMRVMEAGVHKFSKKLGVSPIPGQTWQPILDGINKVIKGMNARTDPTAKVYAEAAAHLYNVKVAWRNEVMHPKETYTEEEAENILRNVKAFICDLADLL